MFYLNMLLLCLSREMTWLAESCKQLDISRFIFNIIQQELTLLFEACEWARVENSCIVAVSLYLLDGGKQIDIEQYRINENDLRASAIGITSGALRLEEEE